MQNLRRHTAEMFSVWHLDGSLGARELESAANKLRRHETTFLTTTPRDNRAVWFKTLEPGFASGLFAAGFRVLPEMVKIYPPWIALVALSVVLAPSSKSWRLTSGPWMKMATPSRISWIFGLGGLAPSPT